MSRKSESAVVFVVNIITMFVFLSPVVLVFLLMSCPLSSSGVIRILCDVFSGVGVGFWLVWVMGVLLNWRDSDGFSVGVLCDDVEFIVGIFADELVNFSGVASRI